MKGLRYWVGFNIVRGIGPTRLRALLDYFGDVERAWRAPAEELRCAGLDRRSLITLLAARAGQGVSTVEEVFRPRQRPHVRDGRRLPLYEPGVRHRRRPGIV